VSQNAPDPSPRWRYEIGADGTLRRVDLPAGPPSPAAGPSTLGAPGSAVMRGVVLGGGVSLLSLAVVAITLWLSGSTSGHAILSSVAPTGTRSSGSGAAGTAAAQPVAPLPPASLSSPATPGSTAGPAAPITIDRQSFVRDFWADFPDLALGRTDQELLADADALCIGLRKPLSWPDLVRQVQSRYGAGRRAPSVLSLISSQICPPPATP
jgi:hypothetical protein